MVEDDDDDDDADPDGDNQNDRDETTEEEDEESSAPLTAKPKHNPHCDKNFVRNTSYKLLVGNTDDAWGETILTNTSPKVPNSRKTQTMANDYVLITGKDITLLKRRSGGKVVSFEPRDELILKKDWSQFDDDMTGQDLVDLDDVPFLLWWQNVLMPAPKTRRKSSKAKGAKD
jgi:hypothetical protein